MHAPIHKLTKIFISVAPKKTWADKLTETQLKKLLKVYNHNGHKV